MARRLKALVAGFSAFWVSALLVPLFIAAVRTSPSLLHLIPSFVVNWVGLMVWFFGWPNLALIAVLVVSFASGRLKVAVPAGLAAGALSYLGFIVIMMSILP